MQLHMQADGMKLKLLVIMFVLLLGLNSFNSLDFIENIKASSPDPPTYYVDDDNTQGPWDGSSIHPFRYIQDAINAVNSSGYRIQVLAGTYTENIIINKTSLDLFGEDKSITTISGGSSGDVITITSTGVDLSGFTIKSSGTNTDNAAVKINASNSVIVDNIISNSKNGFYIYNCTNTRIYYNTISSNSQHGIYLKNSKYNNITYTTITGATSSHNGIFLYNSSINTIANCTISSNGKNGIYFNSTCNNNQIEYSTISNNRMNGIYLNDHCNNNTIERNTGTKKIYYNLDSGIRLENSSFNELLYNNISKNDDYGIMVLGSNNIISNNSIIGESNTDQGIFLFGDYNTDIYFNNIQGNTKDGIRVQNSTSSSIFTNNITHNSEHGIYINYYAVDNLIYNNFFFSNTDNALDLSPSNNNNLFYRTPVYTGFNIVNGQNKKVSGNYWDDFDQASEGAYDYNDNGLSNTSHSINISNSDRYPILDNIKPEISIPSVDEYIQTLGLYTYISSEITDNTFLEDVRIVYTDPNGDVSNESIFSYKSGNIYYYNHKFLVVGTYNYRIIAKDPRNWNSSDLGYFKIEEGDAPTIVDNSATTGSTNSIFRFNATITDDTDSASILNSNEYVKVNWRHGSYHYNQSMANIAGTNYFVLTISLDNSTDDLAYQIFARDQWGNSITSQTKSINITDIIAPQITINRYGESNEILPNSYTYNVTITDNHEIANATIEYWYNGSIHKTSNMEHKSDNYYEKRIIINEKPNRLYCIIYASDPSGNTNNTKTPHIDSLGPFYGVVGIDVNFSALYCYDLDGMISNYTWNYGDGTTGSGKTSTHTYSSTGNYSITLTISDDDGNTKTASTFAKIISSKINYTSYDNLNELEDLYNITLSDEFYSYDTNGDSVVDSFIDPNNILKTVHLSSINISGNIVFLLSINDSVIPEFMWNTTTDKILKINHTKGTINKTSISFDSTKTVFITVDIEKTSGWIFLEVNDPDLKNFDPEIDIDYSIKDLKDVEKIGTSTGLQSYQIFRKTDKTFILDDPAVTYKFTYKYEIPDLKDPVFSPETGSVIGIKNKTIRFSYDVPVIINSAFFYDPYDSSREGNIISKLKTTDYKTYSYTPPSNLNSGLYYLEIEAEPRTSIPHNGYEADIIPNAEGTNFVEAAYKFESYEVKEAEFPLFILMIIIGLIGATGATLFVILRKKNINLQSFVYFKNKKIIPFFKPLIIGPLRIDVNDKNIKKAEFYVNGKLKDTIDQEPYIWTWNEPSFNKQTIETRIYDQEGKSSSSGEMTFFVFNSPKLFK